MALLRQLKLDSTPKKQSMSVDPTQYPTMNQYNAQHGKK